MKWIYGKKAIVAIIATMPVASQEKLSNSPLEVLEATKMITTMARMARNTSIQSPENPYAPVEARVVPLPYILKKEATGIVDW